MAWTSSQKSLSAKVKNKEQTKYEMKTIKTLAIGLAAFALLAFSPSAVRASLLWNFSYVDTATGGTLIQASGTLTTSDVLTAFVDGSGMSGYQVTGISGERNTLAITGINPNGSFPAAIIVGSVIFDNGLLTPPPQFDNNGLSFFVAPDEYNLFSVNNVGGGYYEAPNGTFDYVPVTLTLSQVPEPTTMIAGALLLLPFGASTLRVLRRHRKQAA